MTPAPASRASIRPVRPEEWERARDLRLRALEDSPDAFGATLEHERTFGEAEWRSWVSGWKGTTNVFLTAEDGETWLGMAVGSVSDGDPVGHLYAMWVEPDARRSGLGTTLVDGVLAWAREAGVPEIELGVTENHGGAVAFYERMGFADTGQRHPLRDGHPLSVRVLRRAP